MSSYIMHMCISDIVKRKLNLTDKYIYGSVLPDIIKGITGDRKGTHYLEKVKLPDGNIRNLPDIQKAINELDIQDKEVKLGYISHLLEDYIWFNKYIPNYAKIISQGEIKYLCDGKVRSSNQFTKDMYKDYSNSSFYVINKCQVDFEKLKSNLLRLINNEKHIETMLNNVWYSELSDISQNTFMTKESIDSYIKECTEEVEKLMLELMGE